MASGRPNSVASSRKHGQEGDRPHRQDELALDGRRQAPLGRRAALFALLAKFIQATEGYFHPSNYGKWAPKLGRFLQNVTWELIGSRENMDRRATVRIVKTNSRLMVGVKRHSVGVTIANAQAALKTMALLEPDLIVPSVLERAFPALE
jgi:proteasome activator subunit 4